jgi:PASTA domain
VPGAGQNSSNPFCPNCTFVWGIFPYSDYFLASDMNTGLWVLKVRCTVPNVRGLTLARARAALAAADCRTGRITRASRGARRGRVVAQRPGPGARPRFPAAVRLTVS